MHNRSTLYSACAVAFGAAGERQIGLLSMQPSGEIAKGAAEQAAPRAPTAARDDKEA